MDIISASGGKVTGIQFIMEMLGLSRDEIMAFGDAENDTDMLKFAGTGIAMGNARDSVKLISDYVTDSIDDDGIEKALKHFRVIC